MKKLLSIVLAVLMLAMGTVAFAGNFTIGESGSSDWYDAYLVWDSEGSQTVISVTIYWPEDMTFAYGAETQWNPETLKDEAVEGAEPSIYYAGQGTPDIWVENRSNTNVVVEGNMSLYALGDKIEGTFEISREDGILTTPWLDEETQEMATDKLTFIPSFSLKEGATLEQTDVESLEGGKLAKMTITVSEHVEG